MSTNIPTPLAAWTGLITLVMEHKGSGGTQISERIGMPFSRYRALRKLESAPHRQSELATSLRVDAPATSVIVSDLVERGLVSRQLDPADGRCKLVSLTDDGREFLKALRRSTDIVPAPVAALTDSERVELVRLTDKMRLSATGAAR